MERVADSECEDKMNIRKIDAAALYTYLSALDMEMYTIEHANYVMDDDC